MVSISSVQRQNQFVLPQSSRNTQKLEAHYLAVKTGIGFTLNAPVHIPQGLMN